MHFVHGKMAVDGLGMRKYRANIKRDYNNAKTVGTCLVSHNIHSYSYDISIHISLPL